MLFIYGYFVLLNKDWWISPIVYKRKHKHVILANSLKKTWTREKGVPSVFRIPQLCTYREITVTYNILIILYNWHLHVFTTSGEYGNPNSHPTGQFRCRTCLFRKISAIYYFCSKVCRLPRWSLMGTKAKNLSCKNCIHYVAQQSFVTDLQNVRLANYIVVHFRRMQEESTDFIRNY